ncbi:cytochrome p450 [Phlyctema vagabunda]|uniref:Cytochrome p450 n=1 Tax=Phlyctema vagabunda TaxID=108571 RepID=A0ABR4PTM9_9HELO
MESLSDYYRALTEATKRVDLSILAMLGLFIFALSPAFVSKKKYGIPIVGYKSVFEPAWFLRLRFIRGSRSIIKQGYEKYRDLFVIRRWGTDVVIIGERKYLEEIRSKTKDSVRSVEPFLIDLAGDFFNQGQAFMESDLQNRVLQHKLTPNLVDLVPIMKSELGFAMQKELPDGAEDWVEVDLTHVFARTIARIVARIWIGPEECRNEEWLEATTDFTENIFLTGFILRFVPRFLRPVVAPFLPTYRSILRSSANAHRIVGGLASKRSAGGSMKDGTAKPEDVLQWTMDLANEKELEEKNLAERILVLSLSAIHTTALTMAQALFDLCAHPEHIETVRTELVDVLRAEGEWSKTTLQNFSKLDSLLKESQRLNSVFLLTFNRYLPIPVTLSNGIHLPARTRIAVPQYAIINDAANVPGVDPSQYDPWRYSRLREDPKNAQKYFFAMTDSTHMAFGYGKYACPGRFFVSNEIKMTLAHLLLKYDWKFPEGCGRPKNFTIDSDMYPDRSARVLMRRRTVEKGIEELIGFS